MDLKRLKAYRKSLIAKRESALHWECDHRECFTFLN